MPTGDGKTLGLFQHREPPRLSVPDYLSRNREGGAREPAETVGGSSARAVAWELGGGGDVASMKKSGHGDTAALML